MRRQKKENTWDGQVSANLGKSRQIGGDRKSCTLGIGKLTRIEASLGKSRQVGGTNKTRTQKTILVADT